MAQAGTGNNPLRDKKEFEMTTERWDSLLEAAQENSGREISLDDPNVIVIILSGPAVIPMDDGKVAIAISDADHLDQWNRYVEEKTNGRNN